MIIVLYHKKVANKIIYMYKLALVQFGLSPYETANDWQLFKKQIRQKNL